MKTFKDMTEIGKQNHLKLKIGHGIECKSYREACLVCEQLDNLGMAWSDGKRYIHDVMWEHNKKGVFVYDPIIGTNVTGCNEYNKVPAVMWLSAHKVEFVYAPWIDIQETTPEDDALAIAISVYDKSIKEMQSAKKSMELIKNKKEKGNE